MKEYCNKYKLLEKLYWATVSFHILVVLILREIIFLLINVCK